MAQLPGAFPILPDEQFNLKTPPGLIKILVNVSFTDWLKSSLSPQEGSEGSTGAQQGPYPEELSHT